MSIVDELISNIEEQSKGGNKMMLNKEAIDELMIVLKEVTDVVKLLKEFGFCITSDTWIASTINDKENILDWERKDFEAIKEANSGDAFFIGGNLCTGRQHEYKDKWIIAPKELAEVQGEIFQQYLKSIIQSTSVEHFELEFIDRYGLIDNCGWEHGLCIKATVKESALQDNNIIENYLKEIDDNWDDCECIFQALSLVLGTNEQIRWESIYNYIVKNIREIAEEDSYGKQDIIEEIQFRKTHPNTDRW